MKKASVISLLSLAATKTNRLSVHLIRAQSNFLVQESLDQALKDLKETEKILEKVKLNYASPQSIITSPSSS